jgi:hypothetical protein
VCQALSLGLAYRALCSYFYVAGFRLKKPKISLQIRARETRKATTCAAKVPGQRRKRTPDSCWLHRPEHRHTPIPNATSVDVGTAYPYRARGY